MPPNADRLAAPITRPAGEVIEKPPSAKHRNRRGRGQTVLIRGQ
jgi:hypothetical protein